MQFMSRFLEKYKKNLIIEKNNYKIIYIITKFSIYSKTPYELIQNYHVNNTRIVNN